jgi:undecaprenyl-diphosphatase
MGRLLSLNREASARFSFLLSIPIILAAGVFEGRKLLEMGHTDLSPSYMVGGFLSSLVCGLLAITILMRYLRTADLAIFAWYRVILAAAVVIWSLAANR